MSPMETKRARITDLKRRIAAGLVPPANEPPAQAVIRLAAVAQLHAELRAVAAASVRRAEIASANRLVDIQTGK